MTSTQDGQKRLSALENLAGRFRFGGDVRVRDDSIFQDCPTCLDRNRGRLRVRFGFDGKLNEDFIGGFYLSTGTAAFTTWIGRTLNSNLQHALVAPGTVPGTVEPWLKRLQFDMIYTF